MNDEDLDRLAADIRREWGDRFPLPTRDETALEREQREVATRDVLQIGRAHV